MKSKLRRWWVWLSRCRHSQGFGVQSPSAYRFIRYVINEHWPYYAYDDLKPLVSCDADRRRLLKLYLRLSNERQTLPWTVVSSDDTGFSAYVKAGCKSSDAKLVPANNMTDFEMERVLSAIPANGILVVEGIGHCEKMQHLWKKMLNDERTGVSYDLYYCGIVFFDRSVYKQHYIVNF